MKTDKTVSSGAADIKTIFRALQHRNYRLFFTGQSISLVGTWMQQVAIAWLVYRLTNSPFLLGAVGFVSQIPTFLFSPIAGVIADRYNRKNMLVATQVLSMVQALLLSLLILTHHIQVWHIVVLGALLGIINSFDIPIRQAFTVEMVERKEDLGNAIALNSSMVNAARLVGPSIAGVLIAFAGEGVCFLLNGLSYIPVIASLRAMSVTPQKRSASGRHIFHELKEGFRYAVHSPPIAVILILVGLVSLVGVPYQVLMPVFARDIFHGGAYTLGFLVSMSGVGALIGALYLASRRSTAGLGRLIVVTAALFGVGIIAFSFSRVLWASMAVLLLCGFGMMVHLASSNTVLQTIVEEDKRGRIMSFYTMSFMGMAPFGSLLAGGVAHKLGAPHALLVGGLACVIGACIFARKLSSLTDTWLPAYASRKGIIPEVAQGINSTAALENFLKE